MLERTHVTEPPARPDIDVPLPPLPPTGQPVARGLPLWRLVFAHAIARRLLVVTAFAIAWQVYARYLDDPLIFPSLIDTAHALFEACRSGELPARLLASLRVLGGGYAIGVLAAAVLTALAVTVPGGGDVLATMTAMFNPLPAIALLPLALIWFGLGGFSLVFVITHSVLWAVALNTHSGFLAVPLTQRMAGRNLGLRGLRLVLHILVPAAVPSILTGLRVGWAFAWRTLIAAELVFGMSSHSGGLGWFIYESRAEMDTPNVFAGLLAIILIGLFFESVVFRTVEMMTIRRWGM
jgi:NitT/TauT family transport system permease protein